MGLSNAWSEESRTKKAAQGKTANLALGTPAAQKSPKSGKFLTNINAKDRHLISPDGKEYKFPLSELLAPGELRKSIWMCAR